MKRWIHAVLAGIATLVPLAGLAGIDNTHHDMIQEGVAGEKCAYCHSKTLAGAPAAGYGAVGNFCVLVCHQGTTVAAAAIGSPGYFQDTTGWPTAGAVANSPTAVAFTSSHGENPTVIPAPDAAAAVGATNWPHSSATAAMECTTCHAVHDGTNPPFLNAPLAAATLANSFCEKCHASVSDATAARRYNDITGIGAHPVGFAWDPAAATGRNGSNNARTGFAQAIPQGRTIAVKPALLSATPTGAPTAVTAFNRPGAYWNTGGHIVDPTTTLPRAAANLTGGIVGCYSCHSAHQDTAATGSTYLILASALNQTAGTTSAALCRGCHGSAADPNQAGTTAYYHPTNAGTGTPYQHSHASHGAVAGNPNVPATGTFPIPMSATFTALNATVKGVGGEVLCTTCHDVHGGITGMFAIRQIGTASATSSICIACHAASTTVSGANSHHPGAAIDYTGAVGGQFAGTTAWLTADGLGRLTDGLSCPDCHVFQGSATRRSTAHNW